MQRACRVDLKMNQQTEHAVASCLASGPLQAAFVWHPEDTIAVSFVPFGLLMNRIFLEEGAWVTCQDALMFEILQFSTGPAAASDRHLVIGQGF